MEATTAVGSKYLQPVPNVDTVTIPALSGTRTISNDGNQLFNGFLDDDFVNWKANEAGGETGATPVHVFEMIPGMDADYRTLFGSLAEDVSSLVMTQDQILSFVEENRNKLRTGGYGTFFLFKSEGELFVAYVGVNGDGSLRAFVSRFAYVRVWYGGLRPRVVVPQTV